MKQAQRLDYSRLAEVLHERGMADLDSIRELLNQSMAGGMPFAEALVTSNMVGDWDLSRVVCEIFNLPFVPVDIISPDPKAAEGTDQDFMSRNRLVPLGRFGQVLTVCMPALVPADVLGLLAAESDVFVLPVVGTVETNRRWIEEHHSLDVPPPKKRVKRNDGDWGGMFDEANAAILLDIESATEEELEESSSLEFQVPDEDESGADVLGFDDAVEGAGELEFEVAPEDDEDELGEAQRAGSGAGGGDLPPLPEFG